MGSFLTNLPNILTLTKESTLRVTKNLSSGQMRGPLRGNPQVHLLDRKLENVFSPEKRDRNVRGRGMRAGQRFGERPNKLKQHS